MDNTFEVISLGNDIRAIDEEMVRCFLIVDEQKAVPLDCCFTPGSIALLNRNDRRLFVGDSVSDSWIHMYEPGHNLEALIESLKKLENMSSRFDVIHACHGTVTLDVEWLTKKRFAVEMLFAGESEGNDPPFELPCKVFHMKV